MRQPDLNGPMNLTYRSTEELKIVKGQPLHIHTAAEYAFAFVMQHKVKVTLRTSRKPAIGNALSGEIFLIPAHCQCKLEQTASQMVTIIVIRFSQDTPQLQAKGKADYHTMDALLSEDFHPFRTPQVRSWIHDFMSENEYVETALYYQLQSHLYAIAACYLESVQKPKETQTDLIIFVEQARQLMLEQYNHPLDIEELAKSSGSSPSRFYMAFKEQTGLSPHKYMTKIRMDASLHLLAGGTTSIVEAAHAVGYLDEYYFSRLFKKHMGMTPTEYTARAKKKVANLNGVFAGDLAVLGMTSYISFERSWRENNPELVLEQLAIAQPELIISGPTTNEYYEKLSEIAPVVVLHWKEYSWKERLLDISELLGLTSIAEWWLSYYDMKVENARRHVKNVLGNEPFLVVHAVEGGFYLFGMKSRKLREIFYEDLQVTPPSPAKQISLMKVDKLEEIAELDCENVLFLMHSSTTEAFCVELENQWCVLKPSRLKKRCLFLREYDSPLYNPIVNESLVEQMVKQLLVRMD
ncbi:AraC family transcriptional regulator [Paenibacillus baimaensis]|nr:AraC family transcriptional regulator [Paenibacillus sp. WQ 127069]